MTAQQEVGTAIMQARKSLGLTQTQLGQRLGIKKARVSLVERGVNLTVESLSRVFGALGVEAWLVVGEERIGLSESHIEDSRCGQTTNSKGLLSVSITTKNGNVNFQSVITKRGDIDPKSGGTWLNEM